MIAVAKLLVANRGEIARRVLRTGRELASAQDWWRAVNAPNWSRWCALAPGSSGGVLIERPSAGG